jgi:hypothetical protein
LSALIAASETFTRSDFGATILLVTVLLILPDVTDSFGCFVCIWVSSKVAPGYCAPVLALSLRVWRATAGDQVVIISLVTVLLQVHEMIRETVAQKCACGSFVQTRS